MVFSRTDPKPGSDAPGIIEIHPGGVAANFAFWASLLGQESGLIGTVGRDVLAELVLSDLREVGVRLLTSAHPSLGTACVVNLIGAAGEKSFITQRAADEHISPEAVTEELISRATWLHVGGYALYADASRTATQKAIDLALSYRVPVSLDPCSWYPLSQFGVERFLEIARTATILMPNCDEGRVLVDKRDPCDIATELLRYVPHVALKLGRDGCVIAEDGNARVCPIEVVEALDTTGAGDSFNAGFVVEYMRSCDMLAAARFANALARKVVTIVGARPSEEVARSWIAGIRSQEC